MISPQGIEAGFAVPHFFSSIEDVITHLKDPLSIRNDTYTSSDAKDRQVDDRIETIVVDGEIDTTSPRNFVCLCTRCREVRNKTTDHRLQTTEKNEQSLFPVIRRYRSSNGEELFISIEDKLGYLA